jgi:hypothetical protein
MKLTVIHFFLIDILFLGVILDFDPYPFPWQISYFWGFILVIFHLGKYGISGSYMKHTWFKAHVNHTISLIQYNVGALV